MKPIFIALNSTSNEILIVNMSLVISIRRIKEFDYSQLSFSDGQHLKVNESLDDISRLISEVE